MSAGLTLFLSLALLAGGEAGRGAGTGAEIPAGERAAHRGTLLRLLQDNLLAFWYPQVLDKEFGGYRLHHDGSGRWKGPGPKALVTQARTVWFFSRLVRSGYGSSEHLEAARHGYRFLRDRMWDARYGGFYWEVDARGENATRPHKHLYGQSFGLYALAEYARASGDREALELATDLFNLLEYPAHDTRHGGYREFFSRDWGPGPDSLQGYMSFSRETKLMNTHLHLLEALTTYYEVSRNPAARERLLELIAIQSNSVVRKSVGACTDEYAMDWTPLTGPDFDRVSYGHDVENVWLLEEACRVAGLSSGPFRDLFRTLFEYSLRHGFDWEAGGFYDSGAFGAAADRRNKVWWVQAEGLVAALRMYRLFGDIRYYQVFSKLLEWIDQHQADWEDGEWFAVVTPAGERQGDKAGPWKSPYHNGRAMLECLQLLEEWERN